MADYMLLMRNEGLPMADMNEEELASVMGQWGAWLGGLKEQGLLKGGGPFNPQAAAVINSKKEVTSGFHTYGNNINVGGYIQLSADNIDHAIELVKGCPDLYGPESTIEIKEMPQPK